MFGIGVLELSVIFVVALLIFGPKRLPELARTVGKGLAEFRRASADLRHSLDLGADTPSHTPKASASPTPTPAWQPTNSPAAGEDPRLQREQDELPTQAIGHDDAPSQSAEAQPAATAGESSNDGAPSAASGSPEKELNDALRPKSGEPVDGGD